MPFRFTFCILATGLWACEATQPSTTASLGFVEEWTLEVRQPLSEELTATVDALSVQLTGQTRRIHLVRQEVESAEASRPWGFNFLHPQLNHSEVVEISAWPFGSEHHAASVVTFDTEKQAVVDIDFLVRAGIKPSEGTPRPFRELNSHPSCPASAQAFGWARVVLSEVTSEPSDFLLHSRLRISTEECLYGRCPERWVMTVLGGQRPPYEQWVNGDRWPQAQERIGFIFPRASTSFQSGPVLYRVHDSSVAAEFENCREKLSLSPAPQKNVFEPPKDGGDLPNAPKLIPQRHRRAADH